MTDPDAAGTVHVRCVVAAHRGAQPGHQEAVALSGWTLLPDSEAILDVTFGATADQPVRIALTDGVGGGSGDDAAAQVAAYLTRPRHGDARPGDAFGLQELFEGADDAARAAGAEVPPVRGCTAAYVEIAASGQACVANVGSVRVYQQLNGYLGVLTRDDRAERGSAGGVGRSLGGPRRADVTPHRFALQLRVGDVLIAMTDGVHEVVSESVLEAAGREGPAAAASQIITGVRASNGTDDATVVCVEVLALG